MIHWFDLQSLKFDKLQIIFSFIAFPMHDLGIVLIGSIEMLGQL